MRFLLASLLLFISHFSFASTILDNGGDGLTAPGDYYNDDYKCSLPNDKTLYIKASAYSGLKASATVYDSKASKVLTIPLQTKFAYENNGAGVYSVEPLEGSSLAFLEVNFKAYSMKVLDANNNVISVCRYLSTPVDGPIFP